MMKSRTKSLLLIVVIFVLTVNIILHYNNRVHRDHTHHSHRHGKLDDVSDVDLSTHPITGERIEQKVVTVTQQTKLILAYTNIYGREFDVARYGRTTSEINKHPDPLATCEYSCQWTTQKSEYNQSHAVLFHLYNNIGNKDFVLKDLPRRDNLDQKWVLMAREPQAFYYPEQLKQLKDLFNLTVTFQRDSDVVIPYGGYWKHSPGSLAYRAKMKLDYLTGKNKKVAWVVSNCKTSSKREDYVEELQKYIAVDIYGKCGNLSTHTKSANGFRDEIAKQYKFYIAFENSDCDDYISEKFWNSLHIGIIPIVRGQRAKFKQLTPPNSFIHTDSFITPKNLAKYLNEISSDATLFHKHHEWRRLYDANYKFFTVNHQWMCDLCRKVHEPERKTVDIYQHYSEDTRCFTYLDHNGRNRTGEHVEDISRG